MMTADEFVKKERERLSGSAVSASSSSSKKVSADDFVKQERIRLGIDKPAPTAAPVIPKEKIQSDLKAVGGDIKGVQNTIKSWADAGKAVQAKEDAAKKAQKDAASAKKAAEQKELDDYRNAEGTRDLPIIGPLLKGIDWLADKTKPVADVGMDLYTPGASVAAVGGLTQGVGNALSKALPALGKTAVGRTTQTAIREGVVGGGLGAAHALAHNPDAIASETLAGAVGGGALGVLGRGAKEVVGAGRKSVSSALQDVQRGQLKAIDDVVREDLPQTVRRVRSAERVPDVFPERFRRTVGETTPAARAVADAASTANPARLTDTVTTRQRGNIANQLDNGNFSNDLQAGIKARDHSYEELPNVRTVAQANKNVENLTEAEAKFLGNKEYSAEHVATGYRLMQELDRLGDTVRAVNISEKLAADLTEAGRTVQAASILQRLSPEGQLLHLQRTAARAGKKVATADAELYKTLARDVQAGSQTGKQTSDFMNVLDRLKAGETVTDDEMRSAAAILEDAKRFVKSGKDTKLPKEFQDVGKREKIVAFLDSAEQAALARIAARRNQLNAVPLGEWADHAIVASAQIAKGTIKAATYVEDLVRTFGEEVRPYADTIYNEARKLLNKSSKTISEGKIKDAEDALERLTNSQTTAGKVAEKFIREKELHPGDIEKLRALAKQVNELKGASAQEADMKMQEILNKYMKASMWDRVQAIRYISMLFNTSTQAINAASGPIMATTGYLADVIGTMIDITTSKVLNQPRAVTLYGSNPLKFTARWLKNVAVGGKAGAKGVSPAGIMGANDIRGLTYKSLANPLGLLERGLGAVAKGPDYGTYKAVFDSEIQKAGFLAAKNSGVKGRANIKAFIEKYSLDPPPEAIEQADRIGKNTTFQRSDTLGGKTANFLNSSPPLVKPFVGAVFPFVRTPINIASTAVTMTPGGIIKGLYQLSSKSDASRREAIRTLSLGIGGTGLSALGYYLSQLGIITGANDSGDKNVDAVRDQSAQGKYRFNTSALERYVTAMLSGKGAEAAEKAAQYQKGDKQFDYNKLQPLAFPLAIGAGLEDNKDKGIEGAVAGAGVDAYGSLYGMSTLKGVQDVFQPSYGGSMGEKALGVPTRLVESFLKSFSPGLLAQEARRQDPIQRKTAYNEGIKKDVGSYFKSRTPGLSKTLPPNKTTLGQNKLNSPGIVGQYLNPYKSEIAPYNEAAVIVGKLIDSTGDKALAPSAPAKSVRGKNRQGETVTVQIPQKRYTQLQEEIGSEITKRIIDMPTNLSDDQKADRVKKIYSFVREKYMNKVKHELGIKVQ